MTIKAMIFDVERTRRERVKIEMVVGSLESWEVVRNRILAKAESDFYDGDFKVLGESIEIVSCEEEA